MPRRKRILYNDVVTDNGVSRADTVLSETVSSETIPPETVSSETVPSEAVSSETETPIVRVDRPVKRRRRRQTTPPSDTLDLSEIVINAAQALAPNYVSDTERALFRIGFSSVPVTEQVRSFSPYIPTLIGLLGAVSIVLKVFLSRNKTKHASKQSVPQESGRTDYSSNAYGVEFWSGNSGS